MSNIHGIQTLISKTPEAEPYYTKPMVTNAHFRVDPKLASLLGENYRSTELAIKELIDNSFDADAENVWVTLPKPLSNEAITIIDDGTGMTEGEVRNEYLKIASSRISRKGERTRLKNRKVKGRKGIGKFAGLMVASLMEVKTKARGVQTHLKVWRDELVRASFDLEEINLPIDTSAVEENDHGTEIILNGINQNFTFPNADKLKRILVLEYGRQPGFNIYVDGELVDIEDIPGDQYEEDILLENGENAKLKYTISDGGKPLKQPGIAVRVGGKVVGSPRFFGLENHEDIPPKLLRRVYGEIIADSLERDVTADWGSIIDNSIILQELAKKLQPLLERSFAEVYHREVGISKARLKKKIDAGLENLPPYRRAYAEKTLDKILKKFFGESESRVSSVISILMEAFSKNDYWVVMQNLEQAQDKEVNEMADAFSEFGLLDIAMIAQQSHQRLQILQNLEKLIFNPDTHLDQVKKALGNNLWVLGSNYSLVSTNAELQQVIDMYLDHKFTNGSSQYRPFLIPIQEFNRRFLLVDLKSADHAIELEDRRKAKSYIEDLKVYLPDRKIEVIIIGGALSPNLVEQKANATVRFVSYKGLISEARVQLNWLAEELKKDKAL